mmetsp:Transcript_1537/g.2168  ORF Transcript_1537/g.2168 Transcript_1537/m.2168 type:complete len:406 (+) Transcript_1537:135-1352(+)|eukprot:CAMPEP_0198145142 /NCGR_PEP_ID=MMETSP1443-20131203/21223_1 /TAXON_ID=186043 /ORGANISM="Entomoneis sp., Strain CCMP2396" /LENGTH=405 /DNA_ID=CAMNT_0043808683 /DNA_START=44 /DNA_END=1261 /DNA_ORIENTATION=+
MKEGTNKTGTIISVALITMLLQAVFTNAFNVARHTPFQRPPLASCGPTRRRIQVAASIRLFSSDSDINTVEGNEKVENKTDPLEEYRNKSNRRDQVFSAISGDGGIKVTVCTIRNLVNDFMIQQTMTQVPSEALGRTMTCALLMANGIQDEQVVQITIKSDGPLRGVVGIANGKGELRGYVGTPALGEMPLTEAVGKGLVQIVKNHPAWPRPYNGITAIRHGDIDRDVGIYLAESEQRSCALAAATSINGILCNAAGGYLIEQLPDVDPNVVQQVEQNLAKLVEMDGGEKLPTNLLLNGVTPLEIVETILAGLDMQPLQQMEPTLSCECNEERLFRALRMLPREEVEDILEKEEEISARCHFCGTEYRMTPPELRKRLDEAKGDPTRIGKTWEEVVDDEETEPSK